MSGSSRTHQTTRASRRRPTAPPTGKGRTHGVGGLTPPRWRCEFRTHRPPRFRRLASRLLLRLPEPMLARSRPLPRGRAWRFEPKLDGFRCLVCTHAGFRARSRRGWNMTPLLPELAAALPADVQLDGELVALDAAPTSTGS